MKILVFDNYDSFTYNLVHLLQKQPGVQVDVHRNDAIALEEVKHYDKILLSPGPGIPTEAGQLLALIRTYGASKSILGVCLGHQAIGEAFGGSLSNLDQVYHGIATPIRFEPGSRARLFKGLPEIIEAGRYHSWIVNEADLPKELKITARDDKGMIMALEHTDFDVQGVQFHPESVLTPEGEIILKNWLAS